MNQSSREEQRKARLKAALRENLRRRKAQDRGRSEAAVEAHSQDGVRESSDQPRP